MASAGQAQAHSSQPMHFSRPSGQRLSWCLPWNRGAVGFFSSGYSTVSTLRNICRKVTANPLTGLRKSSTGDLLDPRVRRLVLQRGRAGRKAVVVRQVHGRHREGADILLGRRLILGGAPLGRALRGEVPAEGQREQDKHDAGANQVDTRTAALAPPDP